MIMYGLLLYSLPKYFIRVPEQKLIKIKHTKHNSVENP